MKKYLFALITASISFSVFAQKNKSLSKDNLLKELAVKACSCIDSVNSKNKSTEEITAQINKCIDAQLSAYQLGAKLSEIANTKTADTNGNKNDDIVDVIISTDPKTQEYKRYYYEMERYLMDNCTALKEKSATLDKESAGSVSKNPEAIKYYEQGTSESAKENYKAAIGYYEKAIKIDPQFAFAWDNIGIAYRKLGELDKALHAYHKSLEIDPNGLMPLQNIAVVYLYKKDFASAIKTYEKLAAIDTNNPEVYYGIGNIYIYNLPDYEKALTSMCKAYVIYTNQKSAYRTDAEKLIGVIYGEMKKAGKEDRFNEILKENNINKN